MEVRQQPYEPVKVEFAVFFTYSQVACFKLPSLIARRRWILPSLADAVLFPIFFLWRLQGSAHTCLDDHSTPEIDSIISPSGLIRPWVLYLLIETKPSKKTRLGIIVRA